MEINLAMSRPTLILLPGTLCDANLFTAQIAALSDIADCVIPNITGSDTLAEVAQDVLRQSPRKFALAGLSYGGIIAFEMMRQAAERVSHLALLNTTPKPPSSETKLKQQGFIAMVHQGKFKEITTDYLKDTMLHPRHRNDLALRKWVLQMAESVGIEGFVNQIKAQLARPDSTSDLPNITCPTLVLTGREDELCTVALHEEMAGSIPHSQLLIVEECGHLSTLEQPQIVTDAMRQWLQREY